MMIERNYLLAILVMLAGCALFVSAQLTEAEIALRREQIANYTRENDRSNNNGLVSGSATQAPGPAPTSPTQTEVPNTTQPQVINSTQPDELFGNAGRNDTGEESVSTSDLVGLFTANNPLLNNAESGLEVKVSQQAIDALGARISDKEATKAISSGQRSAIKISQSSTKFTKPGSNGTQDNGGFGPHLLTSTSAASIGRTAEKFLAASQQLKEDLNLTTEQAQILKSVPLTDIKSAFDCPYDDPIVCSPSSKYRTFDGSCNNLANPFFGKADTPFERFLPAKYEDGIGEMRKKGSGSGSLLPNPRIISTRHHTASSNSNKQFGVPILTMTFGQFISHDVNMNTISRAPDGSFLQCCNNDGTPTLDPQKIDLGCAPILIPFDDKFFSKFGRQCISFIRAVGGTDLKCNLGGREQINQVTHYLDGSGVYGSNENTAKNLRTFVNGLLKSDIGPDGREMLLQNPSSAGSFACRSAQGSNHHCFRAGDVRVNQNDNLITIHTLFLREHNRLARELKFLNSKWSDEKLFQEARRINIAQYQHVTYNEYLPVLLSRPVAHFFGLLAQSSGYFTGYSETINPAIRNSFVAAAFRSGHSTIDDFLAQGFDLTGHLNDPTGVYSPGIDYFVSSMSRNSQQRMDRFDAKSITNHLFENRPGTGTDLVATNIQRGRDHGLPSYNDFRKFCGLPRARFFGNAPGGLVHHSVDAIISLSRVYRHVDDIDVWTGMSSELSLQGGVFGPTASCVAGLQFNFLKRGDRFYYENNDQSSKFTPGQLNAIRSTSLSALFCANTGQNKIARNSFAIPSFERNPFVSCGSVPPVDLSQWRESTCLDGGWSNFGGWTPCSNNLKFRFRFCNNPPKNACGKGCEGQSFVYQFCLFGGFIPGSDTRGNPQTTRPIDISTTTAPNTTAPEFIRLAAAKAARGPL